MNYEHLKLDLEREGKVLRVRLNRPEVRNAFNAKLIEELMQVFTGPAKGEGKGFEDVRCVVLQGEGKAFCGGGDLNWMRSSLEMSESENFDDCQYLTRMFLAMDECPKPLIGLVHGYAIGGGVGLTSVCDHIIAESETVFSLSEVKLGLVPACIGPFVLSKVGLSQCRSLFISGERFKAKKAKQIGLVHRVEDSENLEKALHKTLDQVLEGGPSAVSVAKNLLLSLHKSYHGKPYTEQLDFAAGELARLRVSDEGQEGLKAFLEKRTPSWRK